MPSVKWSGNWRWRRILPRDGWWSDSCQSQGRISLSEGDRSALVERVEPSSDGPMLALWEARVVMEVCKADLGLALAQRHSSKAVGKPERTCAMRGAIGAKRRPPSANWCSWVASAASTGRSIGRTARTWRHGSRPPLPRYTRVQAVCGLYFELLLYNMGVLPPLSLSHPSQFGALVPKLNFLSALLARSNATALGAHQESASSPTTGRKGYVCGALLSPPELLEISPFCHAEYGRVCCFCL